MPFLTIKTIDPAPGGLDQWTFSHARHHNNITTTLNTTVTLTGDVSLNSRLVINLSSVTGLYVNMGISGIGIPGFTTITGIDPIAGNLTMSNFGTATNAGVTLSATFSPIPFFILDPLDLNNETGSQQWLLDHQLSHNAINAALNTVGNDLQELDFNNRGQVTAWLDLNFSEHQTWNIVTGIL